MNQYTISIVIAKSRESYKQTVDSLKGQDCEIIVIDGTTGLSHARNEGIKNAKGEIIAFIDDDATAHPRFVQDLKEEFERTNADILGGLVVPEGNIPRWYPHELFSMLAINPCSKEIFGCNFAVKKKVFEELDFKFDPRFGRKGKQLLVGDESELFFRSKGKYKIVRSDRPIVYHKVTPERETFTYFIKRVYWEGKSEIRRKRFLRHLFLGLLGVGVAFIRFIIYAISFIPYTLGAVIELVKKH